MSDWQQLLRYVRGDQDAKLPKDRFAALIESTDARIRELEAQLKTSMLSERDVLHAANERIQELESRGAPRAGWADEWQQLREYADGDDEKAMPREQLRQLLVSAELHMEDQSDYGAMLEQDIHELHDKIAEHEKVCAGTWVRCSERLPDWYDQVAVIDTEGVVYLSALQTGAGERDPYWIDEDMMDEVTHWLDVKEPQRTEGEE